MINVIKVYLLFKFIIRRVILECFKYEFTSTINDIFWPIRNRLVSHFFYNRVQFINQLHVLPCSENKVILENVCYHVSYWWLQYIRQTLITVFALSLITLLLFYWKQRTLFSMGLPQFTMAQGNCFNKNGKTFRYCPVYHNIHRVHLDKPSECAALKEVKHRFSGKRRTLSNSLKAISVQIIFVTAAAKGMALKRGNSVKIRTFSLSYEKQTFAHCRKHQVCLLNDTFYNLRETTAIS